jgi:hypothetical protein
MCLARPFVIANSYYSAITDAEHVHFRLELLGVAASVPNR